MDILAISPYKLVLKEVEEGKLNPFDIDVEYLVELFREQAKKLNDAELLIEAGIFLETAVRLMQLQLQTIFPENGKRKRKITVEEVKAIIEEVEKSVEGDVMDWLYEYSVPVGRPVGSGKKSEKKTEVLETIPVKGIPLYKETDWQKEAKRVYEEIKKGVFRIRTLKDFIAFLYAYMEYEDLNVDFEKICENRIISVYRSVGERSIANP